MKLYPTTEYDRPLAEIPEADVWLWSAGDQWCAVYRDHEAPTWWGVGRDDGGPERPTTWERPIDSPPATGQLVFRTEPNGRVLSRAAPMTDTEPAISVRLNLTTHSADVLRYVLNEATGYGTGEGLSEADVEVACWLIGMVDDQLGRGSQDHDYDGEGRDE